MRSRTYGEVSIEEMTAIIKNYMLSSPKDTYEVSVGTDSQNTKLTKVVMAVAVYRAGRGGIFFYDTKYVDKITNVRRKIYLETSLSLELASKLSKCFKDENIHQEIEIHADIGKSKSGKTYDLIPDIVNWVHSAGYKCAIKPESITAYCIADMLSK